jgi:beta-lactamase regulating signal transducer with metallopeptidase domain/protocatechuate 3,4-dioxygenase beta subunit/thiol-disulfide isomerase/thioredoxin
MNEPVMQFLASAASLAPVIVEAAWKSSILAAVALVATVLLGHGRVLARSVLCHATLCGLLMLPGVIVLSPRIGIEIPAVVSGEPPSVVVAPRLSPTEFARESPVQLPPGAAPGDSRAGIPSAEFAVEARATAGAGPDPSITFELPERIHSRQEWIAAAAGLLVVAYGMIAALRLMALATGIRAVRSLVRTSTPVASREMHQTLCDVHTRLGLSRMAGMRHSCRVAVPMVVGWLRPVVLLPERLVADDSLTHHLELVLLHELAHVKRGDYCWNLLSRVVLAVYWPNPLVWLLARHLAAAREQACDDLCVGLGSGCKRYRSTMLEVARGMIEGRQNEPSLGMAMVRTTAFERRVARLKGISGSTRSLVSFPRRIAILFASIGLASLLGATEFSSARPAVGASALPLPDNQLAPLDFPADSRSPAGAKSFDVLVVEKGSEKPIPRATIRYYTDPGELRFTTGADGHATLPWPKNPDYAIVLDAWSDDHQQKRFRYNAQGNDPQRGPLPEKVKWELEKGELEVKGRVVDEKGQPVSNVTVEIQGMRAGESALAFFGVTTKTDAEGRWSRHNMPKSLSSLSGFLQHPAFEESYLGGGGFRDLVPEAKAGTLVSKMYRGVPIRGRVLDENGRPIAGAVLAQPNRAGMGLSASPKAVSDAQGKFEFPAAMTSGRGPTQLTSFHTVNVTARGYRPALRTLDFAKGSTEPIELEFRLRPGKTIRGRALDQSAKPVSYAWVIIDEWNGFGWENNAELPYVTDEEGRFVFDAAPEEPVKIRISKRGFRGSTLIVSAADGERIWKDDRALTVDVRVKDAATGSDVKRFEIERGRIGPDGKIAWTAGIPKPEIGIPTSRDIHLFGRGSASLSVDAIAWKLRVLAQGYRTLETRAIKNDEGQVRLDLKLDRLGFGEGGGPSGVVVDPGGKPLAGVEVMLSTRSQGASLQGDSWWLGQGTLAWSGAGTVITDEQGRFTFSPTNERFRLGAVHPSLGYGEIEDTDFDRTRKLVVEPWGRIEGTMLVGAEPLAGAQVNLGGDAPIMDRAQINKYHSATTDRAGRFVFAKVAPGQYVARHLRGRSWAERSYIDLLPGRTATATLGGSGRPVIGRVTPPEGPSSERDLSAASVSLESDKPQIPYPKGLSYEQQIEWLRGWWFSPEGIAHRHSYLLQGTTASADGSFRFDNVPAGTYKIEVEWNLVENRLRKSQGKAQKHFQVGAIPGGRSDAALDVGILRLSEKPALPRLEIGAPAPPFAIKTIDGKPIRLDRYKGKYVLIDFWATWCGPCIAEFPTLRSVTDRFDKDDRVVFLSLSLDKDVKTVSDFLAKRKDHPDTVQGFLGPWNDDSVTKDYGVEAIPAIFLVGPDGKVVARDLRGDDVAARLAGLLGEAKGR